MQLPPMVVLPPSHVRIEDGADYLASVDVPYYEGELIRQMTKRTSNRDLRLLDAILYP